MHSDVYISCFVLVWLSLCAGWISKEALLAVHPMPLQRGRLAAGAGLRVCAPLQKKKKDHLLSESWDKRPPTWCRGLRVIASLSVTPSHTYTQATHRMILFRVTPFMCAYQKHTHTPFSSCRSEVLNHIVRYPAVRPDKHQPPCPKFVHMNEWTDFK